MVRQRRLTDKEIASIRNALDYDPKEGTFRWKGNASRGVASVRGQRAGTNVTPDGVIIVINGKKYRGMRLAYLLGYGSDPDGSVYPKDGDRHNMKLENIVCIPKG